MNVGLWLRWSWRDLRSRWVQVAAIALVIALGSGTYAGLSSTSEWRRISYDASYAALAVHDLLVTLPDGTTVDETRLRAALAAAGPADWFGSATVRLVVPIQVDASTDDQTILVPGQLVGVESMTSSAGSAADGAPAAGPPVDALSVQEGRMPAVDAPSEVLLDEHFADHHGLPAQGHITISGNRPLEYVGTGLSPQYFFISGRTGSLFGAAGFAVAWAPIELTREIAGNPTAVNEAGVRVEPGIDVAAAADELRATLERELPDVATTVTALNDEREYRILYDDIEGDQRLYSIFAILIMAGAAFAAFNLTGRIVEAQRREIGIGMSLGVPRAQIAARPLLMAAQIALLGVALGMVVGLVVGGLTANIMRSFFPLPIWHTPFQAGIFLRGATLGFLLTFLATLYPVWRAVRVTPVEAIRTGPRTTASGGWARFVRRIRLPGRSVAQMPLRNVLRAPRRTLLTALGIAAAIATLVGVLGMLDSFVATVDRGERELLRTDPNRLGVDLQTFTIEGSAELESIDNAPGVDRSVPFLRVGGEVAGNGERFHILLDLLPFDDAVWAPTTTEGSLSSAEPALVLSEKAARDVGVEVGDEVTLRYPVREGTGYRWEEGPITVGAIHPNPYRFVAFMDLSHASLMNLEGIVNAVQVAPEPGTDPVAVQRTLFELPAVAAVEPMSSVAQTIRDLISQFTDVLNLIRIAVLLLALLIAFNSSSITSDERAREHATMFAFGLPTGRVLLVSMIESAIIGVVATVVGVTLGVLLVTWMSRVLVPTTLPDVDVAVFVDPSTYLTAAVLGIVAVAIAPLFTARRLRRMDIPSMLRVVE